MLICDAGIIFDNVSAFELTANLMRNTSDRHLWIMAMAQF